VNDLLRTIKPAVFVGSSRKDLQGFPAPVRCEMYVLHAFQKKSTNGISTPQRHMDLIRQRLRDAEIIHKATKGVR
jgi:phage-related protein